ncbi:MAG: hypothetical protein MUF10_13140 [Thermoanaerobaculaceae bacterium]|nr:hypothetical protein [Thermoanaerobaculaceae bacterium]
MSGSFAVTEVVRFDYDRDGQRNRVQFWMDVLGRPAVGDEGAPGFRPEEGFLKYYMFDLDRDVRVFEWDEGIHMGGPPPDRTYPITAIAIDGKTARFEAFNLAWTITDGGQGIEKDTVTIDDGFRTRSKPFYAGDLTVGPAPATP